MVLQTDREPGILALATAVRDKVIAEGKAEQVVLQASPRGSHESNGAAERTVQQVRGMARVFLEYIKDRTSEEFPWWTWALRRAAWVYN
eukprot:6986154-Prorocentrum_lima.AAC.1